VSERRACLLCGGDSQASFAVRDLNREITTVLFHYRRCRSCGTTFLSDVPSDLGSYYPKDYYGDPSLEELDRAAAHEQPKLELLSPYVRKGSLVEIGPAFGAFARAAQRSGFGVTTIEMDERACAYLEHVVGVRAVCSDAPESVLAGLAPVDSIVLWHVLEHLGDPGAVLREAARALAPGGVLAVATPNPDAFQFRLLRKRWAHVDAPRHLSLIPFVALRNEAEQLGLRLADVTTSDPAGRHWNMFGWEYAIRRHPPHRASSRVTRIAAQLMALLMAPWERRGMGGAAYTAVFVKS
jgi:2-polyprenyl-3-methyl-5-hydroxy-6-metoxy-1,4-benzoquinol methylase